MREGPYAECFEQYKNGITPAYAGRTITQMSQKDFDRDHPRLCGKDSGDEMSTLTMAGSPPLMREGRLLLR